MSCNKDTGWGAHCLDGVPFAIYHKPFISPTLPLHLENDYYPEVLFDEYDFSLEEKIVAPAPAPTPPSPPVEEDSAVQETNEQPAAPTPAPRRSRISDQGDRPTPIPAPRKPQLSSDILVPTKLDSTTAAKVADSDSESAAQPLDPMTLKDFDKIDDPFDSVELKTINERFELASLFSGGSVADDVRESSPSNVPPAQHPPPSQVSFPRLHDTTAPVRAPVDAPVRAPVAVPPPTHFTAPVRAPSVHAVQFPSLVNGKKSTAVLNTNGSLRSPPQQSSVQCLGNDDELVVKLCNMGFPRDRVSRAVRAVGRDERTLVEHLISVQRLVDKYRLKPVEAEAALHLFLNDEQKALQYCRLRGELLECGFLSEQISEALVVSDLNRERAIQILSQQ